MTATDLRIVLVTPETTLLDEKVEPLRVSALMTGRSVCSRLAPLVGRLGSGERSVTTAKGLSSYFIDGGFVQVKENVVSLLTDSAQLTSTLDPRRAEDESQCAACRRHPKNDAEFAAKDADLERFRHKLSLARKAK